MLLLAPVSGKTISPSAQPKSSSNRTAAVSAPTSTPPSLKKSLFPDTEPAYLTNKDRFALADFKFILTLGTGTFGRVYLCQCRLNDQYFALKMLRKADVVRQKQVEHINNETAILSTISHPFIVNL